MTSSFSDLPDALVRDLLAVATPVAERVANDLGRLARARSSVRGRARELGLVHRKADLDVTREPSVVGIDGSYQIHRLAALDLCAAASVAVEGSSREARRFWQEPYHHMWVECVEHSKDATNALRGVMISMEIDLASAAPHDLVMLDGSFVVLLIYLNQGLTSFRRAPAGLTRAFTARWQQGTLEKFLGLLVSERTMAIPKYSARNELEAVVEGMDVPQLDGKTLATMLLEPDEYAGPLPIFNFAGEDEEYHLPVEFCPVETQRRMNDAIGALRVVFYRPSGPLASESAFATFWSVRGGIAQAIIASEGWQSDRMRRS